MKKVKQLLVGTAIGASLGTLAVIVGASQLDQPTRKRIIKTTNKLAKPLGGVAANLITKGFYLADRLAEETQEGIESVKDVGQQVSQKVVEVSEQTKDTLVKQSKAWEAQADKQVSKLKTVVSDMTQEVKERIGAHQSEEPIEKELVTAAESNLVQPGRETQEQLSQLVTEEPIEEKSLKVDLSEEVSAKQASSEDMADFVKQMD